MKVYILLALAAVVYSEEVHHLPGTIFEGVSSKIDNKDDFGNYGFGYKEDHTTGGTFRQETGDVFGNKYGSYGLTDADGRVRLVTYVADDLGFRAKVESNEPGVKSEDPADVSIDHAFDGRVDAGVIGRDALVDPWKVTPKVGSVYGTAPLYGDTRILKDAWAKPVVHSHLGINPLSYGFGTLKNAFVDPYFKHLTPHVHPLSYGFDTLKSGFVNPYVKHITPNFHGINPFAYKDIHSYAPIVKDFIHPHTSWASKFSPFDKSFSKTWGIGF